MLEKLKFAIDKTVEQFWVHPLDFLSERDIQAVLFVELRKEMSSLRNHYPAGGKNLRFGCDEPFCINPVTTEYHAPVGRFDVAVLSEKPDSTKDIWLQPCRVGIEIKLWQPRESEPNYKDDVKKLLNYQKHLQDSFTEEHSFIGIAMLFVHPWEKRKPTDVIEEKAEARCPENGVALHLVTSEGHWRKQY